MPAYNAAAYIAESIASVISQSYPYWELIIIDDGSTDSTAAIVKQYQNAEPRIKYLYQQNGKQGKARNLGIKNSGGKYIAFLDADDKWTADKLSIQTKIMDADGNIDLLFSQGYNITGGQLTNMDVDVREVWNSDNFSDFVLYNRIPILSVLVKKETLEQVNGFTEDNNIQNAEDYHLWLKLLIGKKVFRSIPDRLFYYRVHSNQSTYQNKGTMVPIFYVYGDLFKTYRGEKTRQILMDKLKWYIFNQNFHPQCLDLIISHLRYKRKAIAAFIVKNFLARPIPMHQKAVFKLVSVFG